MSSGLKGRMSLDQTALQRVSEFLQLSGDASQIQQLTPDASTREFFRVPYKNRTAIACVYPEPIDESLPQIDVTGLFLACGLPVAEIFATDFANGIVVHEDFGDQILRDVLADGTEERGYIDDAIELIARIQAGTEKSFEMDSIASRLKFDTEKLGWELDFFRTHYFGSLRKKVLKSSVSKSLTAEFSELAAEIERYSNVLTHRDFHAANLMVFGSGLKIIDHQDARIGPASYDLVSLLLDRIETIPTREFLDTKMEYLQMKRQAAGLKPVPDLQYEFELVTIQRCLKAIGTFSNQAGNFGKSHFEKYINPMFMAVRKSCEKLGRFGMIRAVIDEEVYLSD